MIDQPRIGPSRRVRYLGRAVNDVALHTPWAWRAIRGPVGRFFDAAASGWDERVGADSDQHLAPMLAALGHVPASPQRALDVGTGTGSLALLLAERYPQAEVLGIDIASRMIDGARQKATAQSSRARFQVADVVDLRKPSAFNLIAMLNMPPFFERIAELLAPGGYVLHASTSGSRTPFYTSEQALRKGFERRGVETVAAGSAGEGSYYVARRATA